MKISDLVGMYIELRDEKDKLYNAYKESVAGIDKKLDKMEAKILLECHRPWLTRKRSSTLFARTTYGS